MGEKLCFGNYPNIFCSGAKSPSENLPLSPFPSVHFRLRLRLAGFFVTF